MQIPGRFVVYAKKDKNVIKVNVMSMRVKNRHISAGDRV